MTRIQKKTKQKITKRKLLKKQRLYRKKRTHGAQKKQRTRKARKTNKKKSNKKINKLRKLIKSQNIRYVLQKGGELTKDDLTYDRLLGEGSDGAVYSGSYKGSPVAIKVFNDKTSFDISIEKYNMIKDIKFRLPDNTEKHVYGVIRDPESGEIISGFSPGQKKFVALLELFEGKDLSDYIIDNGPLLEEKCKQITGNILQQLIALHGGGYAHRDIKPENIMVTSIKGIGEFAYLIDYDYISRYEVGPEIDRQGTTDYLAPEIFFGLPRVSREINQPTDYRQSDMFSLGIVIAMMASGGMATPERTQHDIHNSRLFPKVIEKLQSVNLLDFVNNLMSLNPNNRYTAKGAYDILTGAADAEEKAAAEKAAAEKVAAEKVAAEAAAAEEAAVSDTVASPGGGGTDDLLKELKQLEGLMSKEGLPPVAGSGKESTRALLDQFNELGLSLNL